MGEHLGWVRTEYMESKHGEPRAALADGGLQSIHGCEMLKKHSCSYGSECYSR